MFDWLHQTLPKNTSVSKDVASSKKKKKKKKKKKRKRNYLHQYDCVDFSKG